MKKDPTCKDKTFVCLSLPNHAYGVFLETGKT